MKRILIKELDSDYVVKKPLEVGIGLSDDGSEYIAWIIGANLHTGGDTEQEAMSNLKSYIMDCFDMFSDLGENLGPQLMKDFGILKEHISRRPLPIRETPVLRGEDAKRFLRMAKDAEGKSIPREDYDRAKELYERMKDETLPSDD